uniref:G_PROTEIN_RECEP_F1_2 domain-containing protein n=1 Tax=Caenorhabditis tropicalis TaxID=1561998 RepID=A0A1I7UTX4_9PELO
MLTPTWQMDLFIYQTVILIPIYIVLLVDFVVSRRRHRTFQTPYYTLMISQGIADIATISVFSSLVLARYFSFGNLFLYSLRPFMPIFYANSGPMMFVMRIVGVFLITIQRYLTVCHSHGPWNFRLNHCPPLLLILFHWTLGTLIYLPALLHSDATFENEITLFIMTAGIHAQVFSVTVATSFATIGLSIIIMYSRIAVTMVRARRTVSVSKKSTSMQDARLTLHVFILILFCIICFLFYLGEFVLSFDEDRTRLKAFRLYYPTVSGNFSFINPVMLLTLNKDVQSRLRVMFCGCFISPPKVTTVSMATKKSTSGGPVFTTC